jgi:hypothetical protein
MYYKDNTSDGDDIVASVHLDYYYYYYYYCYLI